MNKELLNVGDLGLVHGTGFLSKAIQFFMGIYHKHIGLPKVEKLYNHAFAVVELWGQLYIAEALADGINIQPVEKAYPNGKWENIKLMSPKKPYSKVEKEEFNKIVLAYALEPTRYDFSNFIFHARAILSKKGYDVWSGKTGEAAEKRLHCSEAVATWSNKVRPNTFDRPWATNLVDIEINKYYGEKSIL